MFLWKCKKKKKRKKSCMCAGTQVMPERPLRCDRSLTLHMCVCMYVCVSVWLGIKRPFWPQLPLPSAISFLCSCLTPLLYSSPSTSPIDSICFPHIIFPSSPVSLFLSPSTFFKINSKKNKKLVWSLLSSLNLSLLLVNEMSSPNTFSNLIRQIWRLGLRP